MKGLFHPESPLMQGLTKLFDCIALSLLWMLCCLPVVTAAAATAALYAAVYKYLRREEGTLLHTYFAALRENFRRSTLAGLAAIAVLALLVLDALVFRTLRLTGQAMGGLYGVSLLLCALGLTWWFYLAAYSARFNGTVRDVLRFSALLMLLHPVRALQMLVILAAGLVLSLALPGAVLVAPAAVCWAGSILIEKVFLLHLRPEDAQTRQDSTTGGNTDES
ncbi:MAG: DUF624 domain-containing protein [Gemmiger sp.]|uniref:DUF624 domain-containing protein n=1 Tax=Gemmiger sp. TaxID=2049027 RepID=UPI002E7A49BC|nr:DUF624 domain-containing protein [Gemmiger sp.]MEE0800711.1 DUF624 domain-containing protein [Gemmiger sp.]